MLHGDITVLHTLFMTTETNTTPALQHPFEIAGLGKAPYRVTGFHVYKYQACQGAPVQPGTSCDYCGQGIMNAAHVVGADGYKFKVGCDCVYKVGDAKLTKIVKEHELKRDRAARKARADLVKDTVETLLADEGVRAKLATLPHPSPKAWIPACEQTLLTYCDWMAKHAGAKGRGQLIKTMRASLGV